MSVTQGTTTTEQFKKLRAKELDFISRFEDNWQALIEILGIMNPIKKTPGTQLVASKASIELADPSDYIEGDEVALSQAKVEPVLFEDIVLEPYRKRVTAQSVAKYGAEIAVQKTDDAMLFELQGKVLDRFYTFALTGTLTGTEDTFQMAVAMSIAKVKDKFKKLRKNYSNIVVFVNTLDAGRYLGKAQITTQTTNGIEYVKNFLGADTMIISSEIPEGKVVAIPADNIVLYYIDPSDGDFAELGLEYTVGNGETNLIGIHKEGVYGRVSGDTHALMGMKLFAEFIDAIAVTTISASASDTENEENEENEESGLGE